MPSRSRSARSSAAGRRLSAPAGRVRPSASNYSYTVVNDRTVIVEPQTRRIVQIIE
jgi:hypothetical protein